MPDSSTSTLSPSTIRSVGGLASVNDDFRRRFQSKIRSLLLPASPTKIRWWVESVFRRVIIPLLCIRGISGPALEEIGIDLGLSRHGLRRQYFGRQVAIIPDDLLPLFRRNCLGEDHHVRIPRAFVEQRRRVLPQTLAHLRQNSRLPGFLVQQLRFRKGVAGGAIRARELFAIGFCRSIAACQRTATRSVNAGDSSAESEARTAAC